jgi:small GTP-binding protein
VKVAKILVVGAAEAGKSTLINALSPDAMNLSTNGRTVAMDHAMVECSGIRLSFVGVPGQRRFRVVREVLARGAGVAIWVHRAGNPVDPETSHLVSALDGVPYLVYVNHNHRPTPDDGWQPPTSCPSPQSLISGNLLNPGHSLEVLLERIWVIISQGISQR